MFPVHLGTQKKVFTYTQIYEFQITYLYITKTTKTYAQFWVQNWTPRAWSGPGRKKRIIVETDWLETFGKGTGTMSIRFHIRTFSLSLWHLL